MKVSAVGFLFQNKIKSKDLRGYNYTCVIHKVNKEGNFNRNLISSPLVKESKNDIKVKKIHWNKSNVFLFS